jgi:hypothetical protein
MTQVGRTVQGQDPGHGLAVGDLEAGGHRVAVAHYVPAVVITFCAAHECA